MSRSHSRLTSTHKCFSRGLNELVHCYVSQTYFTMLRIFHMDFSSPNSLKLFYNYCTTIDNNRHLMSRLMCNKITAGPLREHGTVITNWECFRMRRATFQCFLFGVLLISIKRILVGTSVRSKQLSVWYCSSYNNGRCPVSLLLRMTWAYKPRNQN